MNNLFYFMIRLQHITSPPFAIETSTTNQTLYFNIITKFKLFTCYFTKILSNEINYAYIG